MATLNIGIKIAGNINAAPAGGTNVSLYTAPANTYGIVNISFSGNSGVGTTLVTVGSARIYSKPGLTTTESINGIYVGPGLTVTVSNANAIMACQISGVSLTNTI